jgi:Protein of unknown function (DUF1572)
MTARLVTQSIEAAFARYKALGEDAIEQVPDERLSEAGPGDGLSVVTLVWHIAGNLKSRFTDFLETDGEKPWRDRDSEFIARTVSRDELLWKWEDGWTALIDTIGGLSDADLERSVAIRGQSLTVIVALHRALAHISYHIGQIVYIAKAQRGDSWRYLSIPPGQSADRGK